MESRYTIHIMPSEWRWAIFAATALVFLAFAPFLWVAATDTGNWQFMGTLHNYTDGATYIAKMGQGESGLWLLGFLHTPEAHSGALIQVLYPLLGHLARLTSLPTIGMFHVARVGASLFMYLALYTLSASIWQRVRARRIFFAIASVGAGFGWLLAPLVGASETALWPDLQIPEAFPFLSTLFNVHFPLTIACLALLISLMVTAFRPGADDQPEVGRLLPLAVLLTIILAFIYPQALVPLAIALVAYVAIVWGGKRRRVTGWQLRWVLAVILPAAPMAVYYFAVVRTNPAFAEWSRQNVTVAPSPLFLALGLGLPLLLAVPALFRAARRFEQADDRLMLLWIVAIVLCVYLPTSVQRRFLIGLMIPVAYFATRALEEVWLQRVSRRYRGLLYAVLFPIIAVSQLFVLFLPVLPVVTGQLQNAPGAFLERDYALAFRWLAPRTDMQDVVLAAPVVSAWVPGWAGARVVYGHPYETLDSAAKLARVRQWYASDGADCADLIDTYDVRYVLVGPEEHKLGPAACADTLLPVASFGQVSIYAP